MGHENTSRIKASRAIRISNPCEGIQQKTIYPGHVVKQNHSSIVLVVHFFSKNLPKLPTNTLFLITHPPKIVWMFHPPLKKDRFFGRFGQLFSQTTRRDFTSPVQVPCLSCWMPHVPQLEQPLRWVPPVARWCWAADLHPKRLQPSQKKGWFIRTKKNKKGFQQSLTLRIVSLNTFNYSHK